MELSDAVSEDIVKTVRDEIAGVEWRFRFEKLKIRKSGEKVFIRATLKVPDYIGLEEAHQVSERIESRIRDAVKNADIALHIEPTRLNEMTTQKLIEKLASRVKGVKESHDVSIAHTKSGLFVTLHAQVDPKMSIEGAHEIAERIESIVNKNVEGADNVTVHIEPFSTDLKKGHAIDESDVREIIEDIAEYHRQDLQTKRIVTYVAEDKRHINIDCIFRGEISIEDAHEIASKSEEMIKERFAETVVTIHMEPERRKNKDQDHGKW